MDRLLKKYVASLITNIDNRFKASLPVLKAFAIFDVLAIPSAISPGFKEYGDGVINILSKHFFPENGVEEGDKANVNAEKLKAEWGKFKFDLIEWRADLPREIKDGKSLTTSTTWTLHRMTSQPSFSRFFPLLSSLAECCLSIPVSNAWPERGTSALKRNKTRPCNRLKNDMLQSLLQISINGPSVESDACVKIVRSAIDAWNRAKRRRLSQVGGNTASTPDADVAHVAQVQVADAAMQVQVDDE